MDQAEGQRWSRIISKEADAIEALRSPPVVSRKIVERVAVHIILAGEIDEVDELLQQFAEAVKADFIAQHSHLSFKGTSRRMHVAH